jgi:hypothetical protein
MSTFDDDTDDDWPESIADCLMRSSDRLRCRRLERATLNTTTLSKEPEGSTAAVESYGGEGSLVGVGGDATALGGCELDAVVKERSRNKSLR